MNTHKGHIEIRCNGMNTMLETEAIQWIRSNGDYVSIETDSRTYMVNDRLKNFEAILSNQGFIKTHRTCLVPMGRITEVYEDCVFVNGEELPLSRNRKDIIMKALKISA